MNESIETVCGCNPCAGSSCAGGCRHAVTRAACACGPECRCGDACRKVEA